MCMIRFFNLFVRRVVLLCCLTAGFLLADQTALQQMSSSGPGGFAMAQEQEDDGGNTEALPLISGARVAGDDKRTRFILDLDRPVDFVISGLANPHRLIVDLPEVRFNLEDDGTVEGRGLISAWRYGLFAPGKSRIVLDVANAVAIDRTFFLPSVDDQPSRLVIDLVETTEEDFADYVSQSREKLLAHQVAPKGDRLNQETADTRPLIVIDPGHGGIDSGAEGVNGTLEKAVVLQVSKLLKEKLEADGRYRVQLTRDDDTFIPLRRRVELAHDWAADLFISVHADSVKVGKDQVRGATVYTLSDKASDDLAETLAASENRSDIIAGVELETETTEVADILIDLARRETRNFSTHFARTLVAELKAAVRLIKNPLRSAAFIVLKSHDVPSVLVELGYLSNAFDEKLLVSDEWRERVVTAMSEAVDTFFRPRLAKQKTNVTQ